MVHPNAQKAADGAEHPPAKFAFLWLEAMNLGVLFADAPGRVFGGNALGKHCARWGRLPADLWKDEKKGPVEAVTEGIHWWRCPVIHERHLLGWTIYFYNEHAPLSRDIEQLERRGASERDIDAYCEKLAGGGSKAAGPRAQMSPRTLEGHLQRLYERFEVGDFAGLQAKLRDLAWGKGRTPPVA